MTSTVEMLARARAAQYLEEMVRGIMALAPIHNDAWIRQECERMTNGAIELYQGAKRDARLSRGVIGRINLT